MNKPDLRVREGLATLGEAPLSDGLERFQRQLLGGVGGTAAVARILFAGVKCLGRW